MYAGPLVPILDTELKMFRCVHVGETLGVTVATPVWEIDVVKLKYCIIQK